MNVWMVIYRLSPKGKWMLSIDYPVRAVTRKAARKYCAQFPGLLSDGSYRIAKFRCETPKA